MELFLNVFIGHLLADYPLQPGRLVAAKRESLPALLLHVFLVGGASALVLWDRAAYEWPIIVLAMGAHFVIEKLTIATRIGTRTRGLFVFVLDQALHMLSIGLLVWASGRWSLRPDAQFLWFDVDIAVNALVAAFMTAVLLGSILVFEATNVLFGNGDEDLQILPYDLSRLLGMLERGAALAAAVWVSPALAAVAFLPRVGVSLTRPANARAKMLVGGVVGLALCLACYATYVAVIAVTHG